MGGARLQFRSTVLWAQYTLTNVIVLLGMWLSLYRVDRMVALAQLHMHSGEYSCTVLCSMVQIRYYAAYQYGLCSNTKLPVPCTSCRPFPPPPPAPACLDPAPAHSACRLPACPPQVKWGTVAVAASPPSCSCPTYFP